MIAGANVWAASGKSGTANRMSPYAPSFSMIAARITEPGGRRLGVRVGQPGVEREHRDLDREGEEEGEEGAELERRREAALGRGREEPERLEVEGAGPARRRVRRLVGERGREDRDEHQQRADERVEDELDRRVDAVRRRPRSR